MSHKQGTVATGFSSNRSHTEEADKNLTLSVKKPDVAADLRAIDGEKLGSTASSGPSKGFGITVDVNVVSHLQSEGVPSCDDTPNTEPNWFANVELNANTLATCFGSQNESLNIRKVEIRKLGASVRRADKIHTEKAQENYLTNSGPKNPDLSNDPDGKTEPETEQEKTERENEAQGLPKFIINKKRQDHDLTISLIVLSIVFIINSVIIFVILTTQYHNQNIGDARAHAMIMITVSISIVFSELHTCLISEVLCYLTKRFDYTN